MNRGEDLIISKDLFRVSDQVLVWWDFVDKAPVLIEKIIDKFVVQFNEFRLYFINRIDFDFTGVNKVL